MVRYLDYSDRIARRTEELFAVKIEAYEMILQVDSRELRTLLSLRYLSYLTWEQIAEEMEVDVRHVYRLHKAALLEAELLIF
nr:MAG TPA: ECF sigma factor [Caudoviricetes sp.]